MVVSLAVIAASLSIGSPAAMAADGDGGPRVAPAATGADGAGSHLDAPAATAAADGDVLVTGSGWGHGVGMSQYGAYGMARNGRAYWGILGHFYRGATVGTMGSNSLAAAGALWVNLEMDRSMMTLRVARAGSGAAGPVTITRSSDGRKWKAPEGTRIRVHGPTNCHLVIDRPGSNDTKTAKGPCHFDLAWDGGKASPSTAVAVQGCTQAAWTSTGVTYLECRYARGTLHIRSGPGGLDLSAKMTMDKYVRGISEVPYSWPNPALKAQVVAARSYARELQISRGAPGSSGNSCAAWCHVRDTTWDQRYVGWGQEDPRWNRAVMATANQVVTHPQAPNGKIVRTFYSSSSGGHTEDIDEVWGSLARPYYQGVPDPWAKDPTINPNASWQVPLANSAVSNKLGLSEVTAARVTKRNSSRSAATVTFTGTSGGVTKTVVKSSSWMRTTFGLKSIYFSVRVVGGGAGPQE